MIKFSAENLARPFNRLLNLRVENFVVLAVITYFSGWFYVYSYFSHFGINQASLPFDQYTVFLYSFFVLIKLPILIWSFTGFALAGVGALLGILVVSALDVPERISGIVRPIRRLLVIALGFGCLYFFSTEAGSIDARNVLYENEGRAISITLTKGVEDALAKQFDKDRARLLMTELRSKGKDGGLGLIWRNSYETVVLEYETNVGPGHGCAIATYRFPNEFVALIKSKPNRNDEKQDKERTSDCEESTKK